MKFLTRFKTLVKVMSIVPLLVLSLQTQAGETVSQGSFTGASDHITTGGVSIVNDNGQLKLILADDFSLDGAPDPKIGFGKSGEYDTATTFTVLESNTGKQVYKIPASVSVSDYNEVYIWCEKFSVPLGVASIQ